MKQVRGKKDQEKVTFLKVLHAHTMLAILQDIGGPQVRAELNCNKLTLLDILALRIIPPVFFHKEND